MPTNEFEIENKGEPALFVVVERLHSLHSDVNDLRDSMKESMKEMSSAVNKLVQMEERQLYVVKQVEKVTEQHEELRKQFEAKHETNTNRIIELEKDAEVLKWIKRGMIGIVTLVGLLILKNVGLGG